MEAEEEERESNGFYKYDIQEEDEAMKEIHRLAHKIREKKIINAINARIDRPKSRAVMPRVTKKRERERSVSRLRSEFEDLGVDMSEVKGCHFTRTRSTSRSRPPLKRARMDSEGRVRSSSKPPRDQSGVRDPKVWTCAFVTPFSSSFCGHLILYVFHEILKFKYLKLDFF